MRDTPPNHYWASTVRDSWLDVPWGIGCMFVSPNPHPVIVTWSRNRLSSDQWILHHVLKFQPRRAKHHAKRDRRCRSTNSGRLMTLLDLSPADFRRFLTILVDRRLLGSQCCLSTRLHGCEWHRSHQTLQCPVVTIKCYPWSAGSWQVFHIVGLCVLSHQSADYNIVVAHLTSNSFEGHPCYMHADYLPSLCFWYSPSYHAYWEWTPDLNTQIRSVIILNFE